MPLLFEPLQQDDIPEIGDIEREAFTAPWPASAYKHELTNKLAYYFVLCDVPSADSAQPGMDLPPVIRRISEPAQRPYGCIAGYAGTWVVFDEAHLTTIAVRAADRGKGYGELILVHALERAIERGAATMTLEVRVGNDVAQRLYYKYGFDVVGRRKNYYTDTHEDALLMTSEQFDSGAFRERFQVLRGKLEERLGSRLASPIGGGV